MKTAFCLSTEPFWGKIFSWKNFVLSIIFGLGANFFQPFVKQILRGFQSCILCFHHNVSKKNHFLWKIVSFFNTFEIRVNDFWPSAIKHSLALSKLESKCPKDLSESKTLFLKNNQFAKHVQKLNKKTQLFSRKKLGGVVRTPPFVSIGSYLKKIFFQKKLIFLRFSDLE